MVKSISRQRRDRIIVKKPLHVVELVGPAGAGKTTLAEALSQYAKGIGTNININNPPYFRRIKDIPFFVKNTFSLLPTFFILYLSHNGRSLTPREIAWMVTLNGWQDVLRRTSNNGPIILLDQGPIFLLVQLYMFGPECLRTQKAERWWDKVIKQWAGILDRIIYLDASDAELLKRIRVRRQEHVMKNESESKVFDFLAQYRMAYEQMISILMGTEISRKVLYFDTGSESIVGLVNKLLVEFGLKSGGEEGQRTLSPESVYSYSCRISPG